MTRGKAAAQVAHAASQAAYRSHTYLNSNEYKDWEASAEGFGTTIVRDAGRFVEDDIYKVLIRMCPLMFGIVRDPSYPVRDGSFTHLIDIETCYWVFEDPDKNLEFAAYLKDFSLY